MLTVERKAELISTHSTHEGDTGSPEVQVALLTEKESTTSRSTSASTDRTITAEEGFSRWSASGDASLPI